MERIVKKNMGYGNNRPIIQHCYGVKDINVKEFNQQEKNEQTIQ